MDTYVIARLDEATNQWGEELARLAASTPLDAIHRWMDAEGGVEAGHYGTHVVGIDRWRTLVIDNAGNVRFHD